MSEEERLRQAKEYFNRGMAYFNKGEYAKAIEEYMKAIEWKPDHAEVYNNLGVAYDDQGDYAQAIEAYKKAIELKPDFAYAYNNLGIAYKNNGEYDKAIEAYNKVIELNPDFAYAYNNLGNAYNKKGEYDKAIKAYNKAIGLRSNYAGAYNGLGSAYYEKGEYGKAIEAYNKVIELKPDHAYAYYNLIHLCRKGKGNSKHIEKAAGILAKNKSHFKMDIAHIMSRYKNADIDDLINTLLDMDYDNYFRQTLHKYDRDDKNSNEYTVCKKIYLSSIKAMQLLHIGNYEETKYGFAHYTRKGIAEKLLIKDKENDKVSPFRLNSILTSNDPTEGTVAFKYLGLKNEETNRDYQAFIACFTFDPECLNQFRLYGKEQGQEATGVSMVFNEDFFAKAPTAMTYTMSGQDDRNADIKNETEEKYSLYRCIYIDPETKQIIALGHKDNYTFFREELMEKGEKELSIGKEKEIRNEIISKINDYKNKINGNLQAVQTEFDKLKGHIKKHKAKIKEPLVCDLLINLRYLIKHIAFKEEQECRIVKVEALANHDKVKLEEDKMFIETKAIGHFINKMYFAPNAAGMEFFQEKLVYNGDGSNHIKCYLCQHPIRTSES
jgi:Flp pilus assembly protein TadD